MAAGSATPGTPRTASAHGDGLGGMPAPAISAREKKVSTHPRHFSISQRPGSIGWSAVGKTVYLQALTLMLMQMGKFWRDYSYSPLTEQTLGYVQNVREFLSKGAMPPPTQLALQEAYIMLLLGMSDRR